MIYQIKHTRHNFLSEKIIKLSAILLLVILAVFLFSIFGPTRSIVLNIFSPFIKTGNYFYGLVDFVPKFFTDKNKLIAENEELMSLIEDDRLFKIDYESVKIENQRLREELGLRPAGDYVAASIIARSPQIPLDSLFIDRGSDLGLKKGDLVLVTERVLIGRLVDVSANKSTVALSSFAGVTSFGYVARTNEPLEMNGKGGGNMEAKVPIDFDIQLGDEIEIAGSTNYVAAIVGLVEEDKSAGFKNILLSLPVNTSKTSTVFVMPTISE
ncbi:MAG: hypothetical protein A2431_03375 [Candidatus Zambryskibacteria bacterium RIFOXYC1_FULL_39_10]|uniref:Rod shape-determining protein MreC beta-barrel core domain-containing protein n=1 Tax=Candidatus Zambryskibacteria bacterium RIFOXYC1_FULL_39_10 TaxID=1802779 RepID=A0A1G2UYV0_9BACT|nr:MAG: hypothetical protein A2431_03375 [Candidatus Zambryskibacteria bacterium RIFOXYC1_FULL_39_10]OHB15451.1 MAG: hypothetical protein A2605_03585 [Candidatus Zambryskibacteria bacterium RIFOXYD1_FULL_39_35]